MMAKPENPLLPKYIGKIPEEVARDIIRHLRFLARLEEVVEVKEGAAFTNEGEYDPGELADHIDWLLRRAQVMHELEIGQCDVVVDGEECEFLKGHDGEHGRDSELDKYR